VRKVLVYDADARSVERLCEVVRSEGAEPLIAGVHTALKLSRSADVALAAGDDGVDLLARIALDRPAMPRIAMLPPLIGEATLLAVIERVHPWAIVSSLSRLAAPLRDALAATPETRDGHTTELTQRVMRPPPRVVPADFSSLVCDPLTGADSYHYLRLRLDEELDRASRYSRPVSLVLMDLDDLRGINDRWGREIGDASLKHVATTLQAGARAVDRVGRWAGGTFALLLPETAAGAAYGLAERLRADVAARRFLSASPSEPRVPPRLRITVSCGVACTIRDGAARAATLVQRSDGALHQAKLSGRNRSVVDG
jgi:diguanylate cyclase (GGDEF)-like protein